MQISIPSLLRIKPGAFDNIGRYLASAGFKNAAICWGEGMRESLSSRLDASFAKAGVGKTVEETVTDNASESLAKAAYALPAGTDVLVAAGGGKAIDACKYMGFLLKKPVLSVPTAMSNDGFCSSTVSLPVNGKKRTLPAAIPWGVTVDTEIVGKAPSVFLLSGVGDMVSKFTAIHDWKRSFHQTGEIVNDFAVLVSLQSAENLANSKNRDIHSPDFLKLLAGSLVMSGVAMEISGSSRPASGSEHLISHALDRISEKPAMHGIQVGLATFAVARLQRNPNAELIRGVLEETGFFDWLREHPLRRSEWTEAVKLAPAIKQNFYTILSEPGMTDRLIEESATGGPLDGFLA